MPKKTKTIIRVLSINGYFVSDEDRFSGSSVLFDHLQQSIGNGDRTLTDLKEFTILAKSHGWSVRVRKANKDDFEEE